MKVELDVNKSPFISIGPYNFNYGQPLHDIVVDDLPEELKKQFLYNLRRGTLKTTDREELKKLVDVPSPMPSNIIPIKNIDVSKSMEETIEDNLKMLKKILSGTIASVKKEAATLRISNLRRLYELELQGKHRKTLVSFFQELMDQHTQQVMTAKGTEDMQPVDRLQLETLSTQITDVVESDEEQIIIPQGVLNQFSTGE